MIVETHELQPARGRARHSAWSTAAMATVVALTLAIGGVVGAYLVNGRGAGFGTLAAWAPADAAMYAEVDLSLPGAQRANVASLLDHWSALNPDLVLGEEFAGWVDDLLSSSPGVPITYSDDLAPWLSGAFAMVLTEWPAMPAGDMPMAGAMPEGAVIVGSRDDAAATAFVDELRSLAAESGSTFTSSDHGGVTVWSLEVPASTTEFVGNAEFAYAVTDGAVILATGADEVQRTVATRGGSTNMATNAEATRLMAALPAERIGLAVMDTRGSMDAVIDGVADRAPALATTLRDYVAGLPPVTVAALSVEADRVVMTSAAANGEGVMAVKSLSQALAERIPGGSLFYASAADIGPSMALAVDIFLASVTADDMSGPMVQKAIDDFETTTGVAVRDLLNWAGDVAVYVDWTPNAPVGGMIALTDDPVAAGAQIDALVDAFEEAAAGSVSVEREGGVTRIISSGVPEVEIAVGDDAVSITIGDGEAARLAAVDASSSLAGSDRFTGALASVGGSATDASVWLDLAGIVDGVVETMGQAGGLEASMILANLEPLDHVVSATRVENGIAISRIDLVLR
jgi:hypothetical protein